MENNKVYAIVFSVTLVAILLVGGVIASNILETKWRAEAVKMSLEKGQNPLYVKCALERAGASTDECKIMMTIMAASKSDK